MALHSAETRRVRPVSMLAAASCIAAMLLSVNANANAQAKGAGASGPVGARYVYKTVGGQDLALFVVAPPKSASSKPVPAIVFFHGGGWTGGPVNQFDRQAQYLAGRGMVAVQVQYRLLKKSDAGSVDVAARFAEPEEDAKSAMRWVRSHAAQLGVDPHRIASGGGSAGGQLAAVVGMVDGFDDPQDDRSIPSQSDLMVLFNPAIDLKDCCVQYVGAKFKVFSPYYHVRPGLPASILLQGAADKIVSPAMIQDFTEQMKKAGNDCQLRIFPGVGHSFFNAGPDFYQTLEDVDVFLAAHGYLEGPPDREKIHALPERLGRGYDGAAAE